MDINTQFLTMEEMRDKFKVSISTIYNWMKQGLPYIKMGESAKSIIRFDAQEVMKWVDQNRRVKGY